MRPFTVENLNTLGFFLCAVNRKLSFTRTYLIKFIGKESHWQRFLVRYGPTMFERIREAFDGHLTKVQSGFRPGQSCTNQINTLRMLEKWLLTMWKIIIQSSNSLWQAIKALQHWEGVKQERLKKRFLISVYFPFLAMVPKLRYGRRKIFTKKDDAI